MRSQKVPKSDFQLQKTFESFLKKISLKDINLGATFLFLSIFCSIKIEQLLFLKFLKKMAFLTAISGHLTRLMKKSLPFL